MAHCAVLRQILFVKVDQKLLRLEAKLLVHDLGTHTKHSTCQDGRTVHITKREGGSEREREQGCERAVVPISYHRWIVGTDMKRNVLSLGSLDQMV